MTAAAGLVSFAGAFVFAWLTNPSPARQPDESKQPALAGGETGQGLPRPQIAAIDAANTASGLMKKTMTEQQLKNLVQDVREKMREYNDKLQGLEVREQRLQVAQDVLKKDIENLENLQIELTSAIANLKSKRDKLLKSRLEIDQTEKLNLVSIAATYDKMDASSAGKILTNLCTSQMKDNEVGGDGSSFDDAVKILHYMTERTKAKLLAELATSEPTLAATLCQRLKQIVEGK
jgi:flagellar motility protein MotE (MotC chaperone)